MQTFTLPVMTVSEVGQWRERIQGATFIDGKLSAKGLAQQTKSNSQVHADEVGTALLKDMADALLSNHMLAFAAMPKRLGGLMVNRYQVGNAYGWHVDNSLMHDQAGPFRTDLSFTLGLTDPDSYDGGELAMSINDQMTHVKPKLGEIFIYPTGNLHQVLPVTRGERLSLVGWIESWVQDHDMRLSLTRLRMLTVELQKLPNIDPALVLRHLEVYHAIVRRCAS